ncbi:DUF6041 domain-containing protein [Streptomyces aurantiacus]|uniref:Uncharacterized protein n=1 Tax=Streptomyces aurantiacus TaxID=47760 RepID=A0A7G1PD37_9ACTN|nr:DUF6041 domain-containing protein [Streptomyces aurantiacus]BCL32962.1 hypothetical protein GCM10017557_78210 [Streptomyces aurantiacus]
MTKRDLILQRTVGVLYVIAGIGKFFPEIESVEERLDGAADGNDGVAVLGAFTEWLAEHPTGVTVFVAAAMAVSGVVLVLDRSLVVAALYGQLLMLVCLVVILVSSVPQILVLDAAFFAAAGYLLVRHRRRTPPPSATAPARAGTDNQS